MPDATPLRAGSSNSEAAFPNSPADHPARPYSPIILGTDRAALDASRVLRTHGFPRAGNPPPNRPGWIRPPANHPLGSHRPGDVDSLAQALARLIPQ